MSDEVREAVSTPDAFRGLLKALERCASTQLVEDVPFASHSPVTSSACCNLCGEGEDVCDSWDAKACGRPGITQKMCPGRVARAALTAWREREPLRDDPGLSSVLWSLLLDSMNHTVSVRSTVVGNALAAIDAALFGRND